MKLLSVDHAQITIPTGTEGAARSFYCRVLGFEEIAKPEVLQGRGGFWLELGGFQIHVGTEDGFDRTATKTHVAYRVEGLAGWREKLKMHDIEVFEGIQIPDFQRFEFRDPFGNRVEFLERVK